MINLKQFLNTFAKVNSDEYVENEYTIELVSNNSKEWYQEVLDKYKKFKSEKHKYFIKLANWKNEIFLGKDEWWIGKTPLDFDLQGFSNKEYLIKAILEELQEEPQEVNKIEGFGYEFNRSVSTLDYFFETAKGLYWLSFSVYD